ncbi:alpha/beta hydrolase [Stenotrophomonas indicatrix]|uniref:alpha/beta hydrolase n=1 Tax=Stenotrophomonas indicatrix TaxID=2045451 RepID=UPI0028AEBB30|nr:alpha/beta hydrolase [Stenotrophomonas indicatrix]
MNEANLEITNIKRRTALKGFVQGSLLAGVAATLGGQTAFAQTASAPAESGGLRLTQEWDKVFPKSNKVDHQKVTFKNRYGITLAADLYLPKNRANQRLAALVVAADKRVKAVVASTMYDMTRVMSKGYNDVVTPEQRTQTLEQLSRQRWEDAANGKPAYQPAYNTPPKGGEPQFMVDYHDYYGTPRGYHRRAVNSGNAWTITTPLSFMNMPILTYIKEISPRPILFVHGEKAHSLYFAQTAYAAAAEPKELVIVPGASHVDLYDRVDKIPFDRITDFFGKHLKG